MRNLFVSRLKHAMKCNGYTAETLAKTLDASMCAVQKWLTGWNRPSPRYTELICTCLHVTKRWLEYGFNNTAICARLEEIRAQRTPKRPKPPAKAHEEPQEDYTPITPFRSGYNTPVSNEKQERDIPNPVDSGKCEDAIREALAEQGYAHDDLERVMHGLKETLY